MGAQDDEDRSTVGVLDKIRANPSGRMALKIGVGVLGGLVVALGIVLIPFPGPGWAIVILGLAIWAIEFSWARHLLEFTKRHVQAWTHWIVQQSLPVRIVIGVVGLAFVAALVWVSTRLFLGVDLIAVVRDWLAPG